MRQSRMLGMTICIRALLPLVTVIHDLALCEAAITVSNKISVEKHTLDILLEKKGQVQFVIQRYDRDRHNLKLNFSETPDGIIYPVGPVEISENQKLLNLTVEGRQAGKTLLNVSGTVPQMQIDLSKAYVFVSVHNSDALKVVSSIVGWAYFAAWSVSFYPQIYENWRRKSVIGLNFDFLSLNIVGFLLYSIFNIGLYAVPGIQRQYFTEHPDGVDPVKLNDVIFSTHAILACALTIVQCFKYEHGHQRVSRLCRFIHAGIIIVLIVSIFLCAFVFQALDFLYICSYIKLFITLVKYVPQAYMNYQRKSTMGWSIGNIMLDFTGGILSIAQMFLIAYNYDDWTSIFGDPTKFGLGLFSVVFDIFFMLQHYVIYRNRVPHEELINNDGDENADTISSGSDEHNRIGTDPFVQS